MATQDVAPRRESPKTSFFNDPKVRGLLYQVIVIAALVVFVAFIWQNTLANLAKQNKTTGFDFLWDTSGFDVLFSLIPYDRSSYYYQALLVGLLNTGLVAVIGIVLATMLGFFVGVARLSNNWLVARLATIYIELFRNIPLLLQLFFWYFAVLKSMPGVKQSYAFFEAAFLNQRGFYVPAPLPSENFWIVVLSVVIAIGAVFYLRRRARIHLEATGNRMPVVLPAIGILIVLPALAWLLSGATLDWDLPQLKGFNYQGGLTLPPEFLALVFGLTIYTSAFIAEVVRAGINSVSHGQTEAAQSLGLKDGDRLRLVIIPQAMRVIIPPLTSQYLNLTKNSSLAAFIGFPELVSVFMGTTLNQTGRAIEVVAITMLIYLTLSLGTSAFMNWYNERVRLVER
ncbi:amino acid ABC transporter permease [Cucumibacter marinus]|uniref:amino acid ABC transporter permease n=1 Tax=Cucumibacter marinus TaxID=1121252 RepID=UPI00040EFDC0|nr:amino acid ABC transporter permease [Cucumibacter marinus]